MLGYNITEDTENEFKLIFRAENDTEDTIVLCPNVGKDGLDDLMGEICDFLETKIDNDTNNLVVQNSGEKDPLGIIVDIYYMSTDEPDTCTFWFEDYE